MAKPSKNNLWITGLNPGGFYFEHEPSGFNKTFDIYSDLSKDEMFKQAIDEFNQQEKENEKESIKKESSKEESGNTSSFHA